VTLSWRDERVTVGFDPGTNTTGWCVIGSTGNPIRTRYHSSGMEASTAHALLCLIQRLDLAYPVRLTVAIEALAGIAYPVKGPGVVSALISSSRVSGILTGICHGRISEVSEMTAREWRGAVLKKPHASDHDIAATIPRLIEGWPKRSSVHVRDAAGVALATAWLKGGRA
jgi:Holliday junction resolvasome RuvABC endonuclease subunit